VNKPANPAFPQARTAISAANAACPAVAGFRPAGAALAVAAAFLSSPMALAQASGAQAIHGHASLSQQGANLLVTTQNGAGTNHSAINWQSFSVPGGSTTHFAQPHAASLSINRVVGNNPSAIFGTLSSNGRLVLVNPSGIAVGAGAVVDTAGFTASTLRMSDANALAGRLVFGGDGLASGALSVDGKILARSGDVVLIAPNVQVGSTALVQSPGGATILAAGQKVELTGRGLEGIRMELQAPGDQALNLGTLQGDAVGVFAGQLKHSGLIQATGVSAEGGKVVLRAGGDNLVDGRVVATAGNKGGAIDVLGGRVALFGNATLEASGEQGGGRIRVGGDYQGANPDVPNASSTFVGENVAIKADATQSGDGGRVIVWADEATRFRGQISARGGEQGGNGGFAEVSGKQYLEYSGSTDLRAPKGKVGTLLLDPNDITIQAGGTTDVSQTPGSPYLFGGGVSGSVITEADLEAQLANSDVLIKTSTTSAGSGSGNLTVAAALNWGTNALALEADNNISLQNTIDSTGMLIMIAQGAGTITQSAGSTIKVADLVLSSANGAVTLNENNMVDRLAASVHDLSFTNNKSLEIATLSRAGLITGSVAGVTTDSSIYIETTAGDLKTTSAVSSFIDGSVALAAAGSLQVNGYVAAGAGAGMSLRAGTDITQGAGGLVEADLLLAQATSGQVALGGANQIGTVAGTAGGAFGLKNGKSLTIGSAGGVSGVTAGGLVAIETTAGNLTMTSAGPVTGGAVALTAAGSILGSGFIRSLGAINPASIQANGAIRLNAAGSIAFDSIYTTPSSSSAGYAGGAVTLISGAGNISGNGIFAAGGYNYGTGVGGTGGEVQVSAASGSVTLGSIDASGGFGQAGGGKGGLVGVLAKDAIQIGYIDNSGGDANTSFGSGSGGLGGTVGLRSINGSITVTDGVYVDGGDGAPGGDGGSVGIQAPGDISIGTVDAAGGYGASGGNGANGGNGGQIGIDVGGKLSVFGVYAGGGMGEYGVNGGTGGRGGRIDILKSTGALVLSGANLDAAGGAGGGTTSVGSGSGGSGGAGGAISVRAEGSGLTLQNSSLMAAGGFAGYDGSSAPTPGAQGNVQAFGTGGTIIEGEVDFDGVWVNVGTLNASGSAGIYGGGLFVNAGEVNLSGSAYLSSYGAYAGFENRAGGRLSVSELAGVDSEKFVNDGEVNLSGSAYLSSYGGIENRAGGRMNISESAGVGGGGLFLNSGDVNLSGSVSLAPYGAFENQVGGRISLLSGTAQIGLKQNHGLVDIAAGASLYADNFYLNQGDLRVNGTLLISGAYSCTECTTTSSLSSGSGGGYLTNNTTGRIAGTGTIDLDDGAGTFGTLYNYGKLYPGDVDTSSGQPTVGTLTINGNLNMAPGSVLAVDVASAESYDRLQVMGTTTFEGVRSTQLAAVASTTTTTSSTPPPAQIQVTYVPGASFAAGSQFNVLPSADLLVELEPQLVGATELALAPYTAGAGLSLVATSGFPAPPAPPPAPPPLTGSTLNMIDDLIAGDFGDAVQVQSEANNPLVIFTTLLQEEEEKQAEDSKGLDNLVDDNQCRR